jgi:hypothetical protein
MGLARRGCDANLVWGVPRIPGFLHRPGATALIRVDGGVARARSTSESGVGTIPPSPVDSGEAGAPVRLPSGCGLGRLPQA